ncbi:MAG: ATP-binding cassette domain-containing protein [Lentisphaeria bacterium]|nr:ATP-binding cassette domain-containing protein [Lentisphaeria bacterium]
MALITLKDISVSFGGDPVLDGIAFQLEPGQRVCLLGRNGEGKTTLMKVISGELPPDAGTIQRQPDLKIARLRQDVPDTLSGTVFDVVSAGMGVTGEVITDYHHALVRAESGSPGALRELGEAQHRLEALGAWDVTNHVDTVLTRMGLDAESRVETLSGGMKRRVLLARALAGNPDILLLDEPTNHLDIDAIDWLEDFLTRFNGALFFVTHDRAFMRGLATRILELDRGALFNWPCDYDTFLKRKNQLLEDEKIQNARADRLLSQEEAWIRKGIKARRTRNEGRVKRLVALREESKRRRVQTGMTNVTVQEGGRSGDIVARAENASFSYAGGKPVINGLTTTIQRGDRVGIIGPNGCGKSTLLKMLLGKLAPTTGMVKTGSRVDVVYFDQLREALDPVATVFETINDGKDKVMINGHWRSVFSYLQDFLFSPERARGPVMNLSGGEKNRLMLAKLLTRPANLLVMDEPTNDLDIETLELLEEKLLDFEGTLLLVSHDRQFINNVVTSTLVFEDGIIREYAGGFDDWQMRKAARETPAGAVEKEKAPDSGRTVKRLKSDRPRKLTYKEERELEALPVELERLEAKQEALCKRLGEPAFYQTAGGNEVAAVKAETNDVADQLERLYARWEELEALKA